MFSYRGFTLVELMVVIVIISILVTVAMPKFSDSINKAHASKAPNTLGQIASLEAAYYAEEGGYLLVGPSSDLDGAIDVRNSAIFTNTLGVNSVSQHFQYQVTLNTANDDDSFMATATVLNNKLGSASGNSLTLDDKGTKGFSSAGIIRYVPSWQ